MWGGAVGTITFIDNRPALAPLDCIAKLKALLLGYHYGKLLPYV